MEISVENVTCVLDILHISCTYGICDSVFSCGQEKFHSGELNMKELDNGNRKKEKQVQLLKCELENKKAACRSVKEPLSRRIEADLFEENIDEYMYYGQKNWTLLRKHVHAVEQYCKNEYNGKRPAKKDIKFVLRKALEGSRSVNPSTIRARQRHENTAKHVLERRSFQGKLTNEDLELIEVLKHEKPSTSLAEISSILLEMGNSASISAISCALKTRMPSGHQYSRKKLTMIARERFTQDNILYTQLFIDYLSAKNPYRIKFFDESGLKLPDCGTRVYGHAPVGMRCVELVKKWETRNVSLNMLVSLNGPEYFNLIDGATDTVEFLNIFTEAAEAVNISTGRPALENGDIIVMDNLNVHHYDGGTILEDWLSEMGIELLYTPVYSPDLNPIESCFGKVKADLNGQLQQIVQENLKLVTIQAIETISSNDMKGYYKNTSYLFV